jgi:predicted  nucleic acid-binding Zn-ribbon protein
LLEKRLKKCRDASKKGGNSDKTTALEDEISQLRQEKNKLDHDVAEAKGKLQVLKAQRKSIYEGAKKRIFDLVTENKHLTSELEYARDISKVKQNKALKDKLRNKDKMFLKNFQDRIYSLYEQLQGAQNEIKAHKGVFKDSELQVEPERIKVSEKIADLEAWLQQDQAEKMANAESYIEFSGYSKLKRGLADAKKELADCEKALGDLNSQYKADMAKDATITKDLKATVEAYNQEKATISQFKKGEDTLVSVCKKNQKKINYN